MHQFVAVDSETKNVSKQLHISCTQ